MIKLIIEAIVVGISVVLFGTLSSKIFSGFFKVDLPPVCKEWNKNFVMEITLFFTGVFAHLAFELMGINKWYCKNGCACSKT